MSVDESGAPWPYDPPEEGAGELDEPSWECPGGMCDCHPVLSSDPARLDHRILFFDHQANRLPGARCRVFENGQMLNKESPYADGEGSVTVRIRPGTKSLHLEWAPKELPTDPRYPYRIRYHVVLGASLDRGVARRLHNIGFGAFTALRENVSDFQREYTLTSTPSGEPADIDETLKAFHDLGTLPPLGNKVPAKQGNLSTRKGLVGDQDGDSPGSASKAKTGDGAKDGDAKPAPQGCASPINRPVLQLELLRAFSIQFGDLQRPSSPTDEALSDPDEILKELYKNPDQRTFRFPKSKDNSVAKANVAYFLDGTKKTTKADDSGVATLDLTVPAGTAPPKKLKIVVLPPDDNELNARAGARLPARKKLQLNATNAPAGPAMTDETTSETFLYRPFILEVDLDAQGLVPVGADCKPDRSKIHLSTASAPAADGTTGDVDPEAVTAQKASGPPYVKIIDAIRIQERAGDLARIRIDYRPDWIKGHHGRRLARWNRFNLKSPPTGADDRAAPPPCLMLHQTHSVDLSGGVVGTFLKGVKGKSIHYVVDLDGHVIKMADEFFAGGHAGGSQWDNHNSVNDFAVGIEHVHGDTTPVGGENSAKFTPRDFPQNQTDSTVRLCREIVDAYKIKPQHVLGHRDGAVFDGRSDARKAADSYPNIVYPSRTHGGKPACPGLCFPWEALEKAGVALRPGTRPATTTEPLVDPLYNGPPFQLNKKAKPTQRVIPDGWSQQQYDDTLALLKRLLFEIGYSVHDKDPHPAKNKLDGKLDGPLLGAVSAFQMHHYSAGRTKYVPEGGAPSGPGRRPPLLISKVGHIDHDTVRVIIEKWWSRGP